MGPLEVSISLPEKECWTKLPLKVPYDSTNLGEPTQGGWDEVRALTSLILS